MFEGDRVSVWDTEEVLETDGGDSGKATGNHLVPLSRHVTTVPVASVTPPLLRGGRPGRRGAGDAHRPVRERLEELGPQLGVALVLPDEAPLLGREAVRLHLAFLGRPSRGPGAGPAAWDRAGGERGQRRGRARAAPRHPPAGLLFRLPFLGDEKSSSSSSSSSSAALFLFSFSFSFLASASR